MLHHTPCGIINARVQCLLLVGVLLSVTDSARAAECTETLSFTMCAYDTIYLCTEYDEDGTIVAQFESQYPCELEGARTDLEIELGTNPDDLCAAAESVVLHEYDALGIECPAECSVFVSKELSSSATQNEDEDPCCKASVELTCKSPGFIVVGPGTGPFGHIHDEITGECLGGEAPDVRCLQPWLYAPW